jgi:hypothetical protein
MVKFDGVTILAIVFIAAIALDSLFDWVWSFAHRRHQPFSDDDRKRMWKTVIAAFIAIAVVSYAKEGILTALGLHVKLMLDAIVTAIIIGAGADKFSQFADFLTAHEPAAVSSQSVHVVTTDDLTYAVTGEMTVLNK